MMAAASGSPASRFQTTRNPRETGYAWIMRMIGLAYLAGAVLVFFFPDALFTLLNMGPRVLSAVEIIPNPSERFWVTSACASAITVALVFFLASGYPRAHSFPLLLMMSRVVSAAGFAYLFFYDHRYFAYAVAFGTDALVFGFVLIAWLWVITGRPRKPELSDSSSLSSRMSEVPSSLRSDDGPSLGGPGSR
jgi:hypothetical protein